LLAMESAMKPRLLACASAFALLASAPAFAQFGPAVYVPAASSGSSYVGPGDVVSGWVFWGGMRAFSGATAGTKALNICNPTPTCQDINTLANGQLDEATITSALGCNNSTTVCTVQTVYDKVGTANITNATIANRPTLVRNCINTTLSCMNFASASSQILSASSPIVGVPYSATAVANQTSNAGFDSAAFATSGSEISIDFHATNVVVIACGGATGGLTVADGSFHAIQETCNSGAGGGVLAVDGASNSATVTPSSTITGASLGFSVVPSGFRNFNGKVVEGGLLSIALSGGQMTSLNSNQHTYWGF
jgi:hypothetical protein